VESPPPDGQGRPWNERSRGAETVNFDEEDPVKTIKALTMGIGVDRAVDAVGIDAESDHHHHGGSKGKSKGGDGKQWEPGDAPSQALDWAVDALAKAGTLSIIGVYPATARQFPIGKAMNKNLTIKMGNCNHRKYLPRLIELVRSGEIKPTEVLTKRERLADVIAAYKAFDLRQPGWVKVELRPGG